jgi:5-methyltetrahydrofolate--homocysteine methyltransferase
MTDYLTAQWLSHKEGGAAVGARAGGGGSADHFQRHGLNTPEDLEKIRARSKYYSNMVPGVPRQYRRIIDGEKVGLDDDLKAAMAQGTPPLEIINSHLLEGMKIVGELFGKGEMQLPFVLQSAEVMKTAVAMLEPFMEKTGDDGRGTMLLATVRGDVHDIGKNLVDIILTNNGYRVVNIGIKQTINQIIDGATESNADAIGMSGLLVKSTVIMKETLKS